MYLCPNSRNFTMDRDNFYINDIYNSLSSSDINFFKNKNILLLGSDGFLGKYFVKFFTYLNEKNFQVRVDCLDNNISSSSLKSTPSKYFRFYKKDILKFNTKKKYDIIIYLAGIASPYLYKKFPFETLKVSYEGLVKYLDKASNDNSTLIFF